MNKSESIINIAKALVAVQASIKPAIKDSTNPYFNSKYADLSAVWDSIRQPLVENGLSVIQLVNCGEGHTINLETILLHVSGEWISGSFNMPYIVTEPKEDKYGKAEQKPKANPQAVGSAITYARRYALAAIVGVVADEDDDANAAASKGSEEAKASSVVREFRPKKPNYDDMKQEMAAWFEEQYGDRALEEFSRMTNGKITNPLTIKKEANVELAYKMFLNLKGA